MEGSSFLKSATRTPRLAERVAMRRPAPLTGKADQDRASNVLGAARRWREEWRKKRYAQLKA